MKSLVRTLFSAVSIAALALTATSALAQGAGEIVVYNAQHESLAKSWAEAFTADTGIKVVLRNGGDTQLGNQLVQEGTASSADVFLTENSPAMVLVDNAKLFAPVDPATLDLVPEEYRPSHGRWIGIAARSTVFVYDKRKLDQSKLPASIMDLADASWKGRWAASPAGADFQAIVSAMLEIKGSAATQSWLTAMKQNSVALRGNVAAMKAVNAGEVEGAVIFHYYWMGDQAKTGENSQNVGVHYFRNKDAGAFVSISGAGVLASSMNQPQAQAFVKWIVTKGQNILRTGNSYEYAVARGAASSERLVPLADLQAPKIDPAKLNSRAVSDMMTAAGLL